MAQHYYSLAGAGECLAGRWDELLVLQRARGKQDGRKDVLGRARGWGSAELPAELPGQIQRDGTTPVHGNLSKPIARQK